MVSKAELRKKFWKSSSKYYPTTYIKNKGFKRYTCKKCKKPFWSIEKRDVCGEAACSGEYTFIGNPPGKRKLEYIDTWKEFSKLFEKFGYTEILRYPVIARWRPDTWFTEASIYCFQPYVVSGEIKPPANPLIIPQPSLRFNDVENVGITGAHYTSHVHIGQHAFLPPHKYKPNKYLEQIYTWVTKGLKIPAEELVFHEDVWLGGGNFGPCLEFFAGGLELGNQVYMQFKETAQGPQKLNLQVLDMGAGLERNCWITQGTPTSYDVVFGSLVNKYSKKAGIKVDKKLIQDFSKYGGIIDVDEPENIDKSWKFVSKKLGKSQKEIQKAIEPLQGLYSILDHSRTLLFALADGALPSNSGGGYNLRFILRRALRFIDSNKWNIDLEDLAREHARILRSLYPDLTEKLPQVEKILSTEKEKYDKTKGEIKTYLSKIKDKKLSDNDIVKLYDSKGILPEQLKEINPKIKIPTDFSAKVSKLHGKKEKAVEVKDMGFDLSKITPTDILFLPSNENQREFRAKVLKVIDNRYVILDKTLFYAEAGGQVSDDGTLNECRVVSVIKYGRHIVHEVEDCNLKKGQVVIGEIDFDKRLDLMRNHTSVHMINGAARAVLGEHIWQAGSSVTEDRARLDITHWDNLTDEELQNIERLANEFVTKNIEVNKSFVDKADAEKEYGFRIYQGGAVPGAELRIIEIPGFDVEACGGTHVYRTGDMGLIKILKSNKVQDGVIRLEFTAGRPALKAVQEMENYFNCAREVFRVQPEKLPKTCERFFKEWKKQRKEIRKLRRK
ncbi:MAG: alanine--tRNA ligase [Candidatus Woesearchaeota archaeon]|nr:MAG: alanine--tRNA ligase [Candidatus Woesearchaeota archaeon]